MPAPVIAVSHLGKSYGSTVAVDDVSLEVYEGEIFGLIGPNGAGKTTTMECLEGLRKADRGTMSVLGLDPQRDASALQRRIGVQHQEAQLQKRIKVWEAVDLWSTLYSRVVDTEALLGQLGLEAKRNAWFMTLSGGQKQRLFIALALIPDPEVVFLDELTTGLDPQARRAIWRLVTGIRGNVRHRRVVCRGEAAHSGAVPRWLRHDAVLAMSDLLVRIDEHWRVLLEWGEDLVVTAGVVETNPSEHAVSRVPGEVSFALEYRSQDTKTLESFSALVRSECDQIGEKRGVAFEMGPPSYTEPATMSPKIVSLLEETCAAQDIPHEIMPSGAGHDSSVFANAGVPSAMIFVRNDKGSHNPNEKMEYADFFLAAQVLNGAMWRAANETGEFRS